MPEDASTLILGTLGIAVLAVFIEPLWSWTGRLETLVHEAGHTTMLLVTFNWPTHLRVKPGRRGGGDTGLPEDRDIFLPSAVVGASAGYAGPSVAGMVLANGVDVGWSAPVTLAVLLVVLVVAVLFHKDWHTLAVMVAAGLLLALFLWRAAPVIQVGAVAALAWFLLIAGLRSLWELSDVPANDVTDFRYLQKRTGIPAGVWYFLIALFAVFALVQSARWLLA